MFKIRWDDEAPQITIERMDELAYCHEIDTEEVVAKPWFHEIRRYLDTQEYTKGALVNNKKFLRRFSAKFFLCNGVLYKHNHDSTLLRCIDKSEEDKVMADLHEGTFGTHSSGYMMAKKILWAGYYWSTMEADCHQYSRTCHKCQIYADKVHMPLVPLNFLTSPWPFACGAST